MMTGMKRVSRLDWFRWLLTGLALLDPSYPPSWTAGASAQAGDALYEAQAIVTGQREPERIGAFPDCLEDVLVKVSGDPRLIGDPRLDPFKANAGSFVTRFRYHDRMAGLPVHDEQGTRDRPFDLIVSFDPAKIDSALRSFGLDPWLHRPRLAVFLGVENGANKYVLASDGRRGLDQRLSLAAAAQKRGMSIVLPSADALAAARVTFDGLARPELWSRDTLALAESAGGEIAQFGSLVWIESELGWAADWQLAWQGGHRWQIRGVTFDAAFRNGMEGAAQILSAHGNPK